MRHGSVPGVCPGEETVAAYVAGQLARSERDTFELHLDTCSACHELLAALGKLGARRDSSLRSMTSLGAAAPITDPAPAWSPGEQLGRYVVLAQLGSGEVGVEQDDLGADLAAGEERLEEVAVVAAQDRDAVPGLQAAGEAALDPCWRMPLDEDYAEGLKTNFADVANVAGRAGGAITAAKFLQRFAAKFPWAHLDIAGTAWKSGSAKGATGRPVPLLLNYLIAQAGAKAGAGTAKRSATTRRK